MTPPRITLRRFRTTTGSITNSHLELYTQISETTSEEFPYGLLQLREKLCELAGECADGFIGHSIWSQWWLEERALPALHKGASRAGRDLADIEVQLWLTASIDSDPAVAARRARGNVAFLCFDSQLPFLFRGPRVRRTIRHTCRSKTITTPRELPGLGAFGSSTNVRSLRNCRRSRGTDPQRCPTRNLYLRETTNMGYRTLRSPTPSHTYRTTTVRLDRQLRRFVRELFH